MRISMIVVVMLTIATLAAGASEEYQSLFDGTSLQGWHIMPKPAEDIYHATTENFFAKDGALHCFQLPNQKGGLLLTDEKYDDFVLEMDIKSDWGCDSGIFLRCTEDGRGIQVLNDYLNEGNVGFLFGQGTGSYLSRPIRLKQDAGKVTAYDVYDGVKVDRLKYSIDANDWNAMWKPGEWNTIKIRCVGTEPKITTWINGVMVMDMDGTSYQARKLNDEANGNFDSPSAWDSKAVQNITGGKGSIAVQIHPWGRWKQGGSAMYRNIRIKEL